MGNRQNQWIRRKTVEQKHLWGGKCQKCGSDKIDKLEFAHVSPTGLNGRGRGRKERYYDVKNHPESYNLLCEDCHAEFDQTNGIEA